MIKILLLGAKGQIGWELHRTLVNIGEVIATTRREIDLTNNQNIIDAISAIRPDLLINAAAYTSVDRAEDEPEIANQVNGYALEAICKSAKRFGFPVVHYSTDYVFDGNKQEPYTELDTPKPINAYGRSKLLGEQIIQASSTPHLIFRTSWVYGARGKNFLLTMVDLAQKCRHIQVVNDQIGTPTWSRFVAQATTNVLVVGRENLRGYFESFSGIYHLTPQGTATWYEFAKYIFMAMKLTSIAIEPISSDEYIAKARRPKYSVLTTHRHLDGIVKLHWSRYLDLVIQSLENANVVSAQ
ncbi:MAG: dTDP-4-dehydrorhamnose reductase [Pseudanabaenaceae cyanobacterium]